LQMDLEKKEVVNFNYYLDKIRETLARLS
jgi:hypothetical protein